MKFFLALGLVLSLAVSAVAQHKHGAQKGPNGGPVEDVAGVHLEFVTSGTTLTFYVLDESNKPISAKGITASALVVAGADRETVTLTVEGENVLKGEVKKPIAANATISVTLKTPAGKSGQARFKK
ncbi:MAG: hypothetical protein K2P86_02355 [Xanthobacteraceae bacterium]|nr:hypothetical protein [Xanthobacteraceae bacterium]MBY0530792.1 hypothetical protein [Xanthobacteraceae bacterium]